MSQRYLVAGVDVSQARGLDLAILHASGELVETAWLPSVEAFATWLDVWKPWLSVVAVDAPGSVAHADGGREAEKQLRRRGVSLYLAPRDEATAAGWMQVGWRIFRVLQAHGLPEVRDLDSALPCAIECFPYATYVALTGRGRPSGMEPATWARGILSRQGYRLVGTGKDAADAVAAALTARAFRSRTATAYGEPAEGVIWVPAPLPERPRAPSPRRTAAARQQIAQSVPVPAPRPGLPLCQCECGGSPTGRGSRFLPGHDAKLKSRLLAAARGGSAAAHAKLRELGWA